MKSCLLGLLLVAGLTCADESVRLLDKGTTSLTSSTLRWVHGAEAGAFFSEVVRGAVIRDGATDRDYAADDNSEDEGDEIEEVKIIEVDEEERHPNEKSVLVCRARHNGDLLPGALLNGKCHVSLARKVGTYSRYDVLRNVENAARLQWKHWTRFNGKPFGAVDSADDSVGYVARRRAEPGARHSYYLGRLDMTVGLGRVFVMEPDGKDTSWVERDYQDGEVLVEMEPTKYELKAVSLNDRRAKIHHTPLVLATTVLKHEKEDETESNEAGVVGPASLVASALTYWSGPSSEYWGNGRGMLVGLPTTVHIQGDTRQFAWGVNNTTPGEERALTVQAALPEGTAQNISVTGNRTRSEKPYTARLVATYRDGSTRERIINGTVHQVSLQGVKVTYGAHYFLHDGSPVPTTTTTTTTSTSTTTTTSTTSTTPAPQPKPREGGEKSGENLKYDPLQPYTAPGEHGKQIKLEVASSATKHGTAAFVIALIVCIGLRTGT